jgi:hypothetical protein
VKVGRPAGLLHGGDGGGATPGIATEDQHIGAVTTESHGDRCAKTARGAGDESARSGERTILCGEGGSR